MKEDDDTIFTKLDNYKLENLQEGDYFTSECGEWCVHHYGKKGGIVFLTQIETHSSPSMEFTSKEDVVKYLKGDKTVKFKNIPIQTS